MTRPARTLRTVAKAKAAQVAVYDEQGNLVGLADPSDITPVGSPSAGGPKTAPAPDPRAEAQQAEAAQQAGRTAAETTDEVQKMLGRLPRPVAQDMIRKGIGSGRRTVDDKYDGLLAELPGYLADQIATTVAVRATHLAIGGHVSGPTAVGIVKTAVLTAARRVGR